jgi:hypothetical protein
MITVEFYNESHRNDWEALVDSSYNGTFMHKRTFIDYHKDSFEDASLVIYNNEKICGVFPAVRYEDRVVSHPGLAIGGLVYNDRVRGYDLLDILIKIKEIYNYLPIIYKTTPSEFQRHSVSDDIWALYNLKAKKISCELSSVLNPLTTNYEYWPDKKDELSHLKNNIVLSAMNLSDLDLVKEFWEKVLIPNMAKYNTKPTHTPEDIQYLYNKFPVFVKGLLARHESGKMLGGLIIFRFNKCYHVQYSVTNSKGRALNALTVLHHYMIETLPSDIHFYSFGKSTEEQGRKLNTNLYYYKNGFGGGSMNYDTYEY